ncbi:hypothetical protein [Thermoactinomyces mirandus]|uniref:Uncharacterized protein n=1 Tax=Thermoactinomyces mirandus TaxID=2756294 RepID=A0A7W2AQG8_9BACL|nr:hypothetical protein [Thermoactinomyces mirandus]MBA4601954.1 hypothetical protein [Thermoactinomyces mirandus]
MEEMKTVETLYLFWIKCKDCETVIKSNCCQTEKPHPGQRFVCNSSKCREEQKEVLSYSEFNVINDVRQQKIWLQDTPYAGKDVQSIITGMVTVARKG